jgi:hypothetical protein
MSIGAEGPGGTLPAEWSRLERSAEETALLLRRWVRRAREAEEEVERLRGSLEEVAGPGPDSEDLLHEVRRLRAENAALHSRMLQARKRLSGLMQRLAALEIDE